MKQKLVRYLPYAFLALLFSKLPQAWRYAGGSTARETLLHINDGLAMAFSNPLPSFTGWDFFFGVLCSAFLFLVVSIKKKNAKKYRLGEEYGSARWGTKKDITPYMDPNFENNAILTATVRISMNSRMRDPKFNLNKNIIVIGGSGSGLSATKLSVVRTIDAIDAAF